MTDQEKAALLQFLGVTHAQAKQTDQMIVGQSKFLQPVSNNIEQAFASVLKMPTSAAEQQYYAPPVHEQSIPYIPEMIDRSGEQLELQFEAPQMPQYQQLSNVNEVIEQLKEINLNLTTIAAILRESNVKSKTKNTIKD
jgi:hypothetical protein